MSDAKHADQHPSVPSPLSEAKAFETAFEQSCKLVGKQLPASCQHDETLLYLGGLEYCARFGPNNLQGLTAPELSAGLQSQWEKQTRVLIGKQYQQQAAHASTQSTSTMSLDKFQVDVAGFRCLAASMHVQATCRMLAAFGMVSSDDS
jgi:hypothetical protein